MVVRARGALECDGSVGAGLVNLVVAVLEVRMGVTSRRRYELRRAVEHKIINYILKIKDFCWEILARVGDSRRRQLLVDTVLPAIIRFLGKGILRRFSSGDGCVAASLLVNLMT